MAGPEERGGKCAGGSGEAQAQGQPRDLAMAPMQRSLGPPRDEPRVFGLDNFAEWSFKMENIFDHYDMLEVMEGTEKRPENDPEKSPWVRKSAQGYLLLGQALGSSQIRHIKPFQREPEKGPKAWAALKGVHAPATAAVTVVLERQMAALRIEWSFKMENIFDHYDMLEVMEGTKKRPENDPEKSPGRGRGGGRFGSNNFNGGRGSGGYGSDNKSYGRDRGRFDGQEGRGAGGGRGRGRGGRGGRGGGAASMKIAGNESDELEPSPVKHVTSALGQRAEVKGMGKAMFKGADGKMVGLKNVLWVPNLAANIISVRRLQKAGMDTSLKGAKTYTARLGERILWDLHKDRDVYNEMWQIPLVPMPKERQVVTSISTKGEAVGGGDGANGRAKEIKSKKCNLGRTSKLGEHEESGAAAKTQHKDEENPKVGAEEEYGERMWGTIASAAFSNPTSATGECDWLTLHQRMGHVALPILQ
ncbi:unnamed protein product [Closterium sp. NIES-54]